MTNQEDPLSLRLFEKLIRVSVACLFLAPLLYLITFIQLCVVDMDKDDQNNDQLFWRDEIKYLEVGNYKTLSWYIH